MGIRLDSWDVVNYFHKKNEYFGKKIYEYFEKTTIGPHFRGIKSKRSQSNS